MKKEKYTYEEAMTRLEAIVRKVEQNEYDIDQLTEALKEAQSLLKFCKGTLFQTENKLKVMMDKKEEET